MGLSGSHLSIPLFPGILMIILTSLGVSLNALLVLVISKSSKMKSACFLLICGAAVGSMLVSMARMGIVISKMGDQADLWSHSNHSKGICLIRSVWGFSLPIMLYNTHAATFVALDRTYGALAPVKYRRMGKGHVIPALSIAAGLPIIIYIIILITGDSLSQIVSSCSSLVEMLGEFRSQAIARTNLCSDLFCVLSYGVMLISTSIRNWRKERKRRRSRSISNSSEYREFVRQQKSVAPAAKMLSVLYFITLVIPDFIILLGSFGSKVLVIASPLRMIGALVEFISLIFRCKQFRQELKKFVMRR